MIIFRTQLASPTLMYRGDGTVVAVSHREAEVTSLCVGLLLGFVGAGLFLIETHHRACCGGIQRPRAASTQTSASRTSQADSARDEPSFDGIDFEELSFQVRDDSE